MGFVGILYANVLLSIADVSARLFGPPPESIKPSDYSKKGYRDCSNPKGKLESWV
jgi:hypothetical protein